MRKSVKTLAVVSALVAGLVSAPALYAHESQRSQGSMMGPGMMGQGGMMGIMGQMSQMSQMMKTCNEMMQGMMQDHRAEPQKPGQEPKTKEE